MMIAASAGGLLGASWYVYPGAPFFFVISFMLLFSLFQNQFAYRYFALWVFAFTCVSLLPCANVIQEYATGNWRHLFFLFICLYITTIGIISAYGINRWLSMYRGFNLIRVPLIVTVFCWITSSYSLVPLGVAYGFPVLNPLIPLLYKRRLCIYLIKIHVWGTLFVVSMIIKHLIDTFTSKQWKKCSVDSLVLAALFIPLPEQSFFNNNQCLHTFFSPVPTTSFASDDDAWERAEKIATALSTLAPKSIGCLPESAFPYPINEYPVFISLWQHTLPSNSTLILGTHIKEEEKLFNCMYKINQDSARSWYEKKRCLPFFEVSSNLAHYLAKICHFSFCNQQFFSESGKKVCDLNIAQGISCMPLICSELLCTEHDPYPSKQCILCIANDTWFRWHSSKRAMTLIARLRSVCWQKIIIYCSYYDACIIYPEGTIHHFTYLHAH